ncbi:hypothetical protein ABR737_00275 [Streptomyces sp. Edi2]|uniref:hypothetical protein n=1 Tax=Streptomyces sp. Edi2 TaxID=3162528 RepID=UPI0033064B01
MLCLTGTLAAASLKSAAAGLLDAVDAFFAPGPPAAEPAGSAGESAAGLYGAAPMPEPAASQPAGPPADTSAGATDSGCKGGADAEEWARVRKAAEVLRGQLVRPGARPAGDPGRRRLVVRPLR